MFSVFQKQHPLWLATLVTATVAMAAISALVFLSNHGLLPSSLWTAYPIPASHIKPEIGNCYVVHLGHSIYSSRRAPSAARLLENGVTLPFSNTQHPEIQKLGKGRYSYYDEFLYFSASDNTNPSINGMTYSVLVPLFWFSPAWTRLIYLLTIILFSLCYVAIELSSFSELASQSAGQQPFPKKVTAIPKFARFVNPLTTKLPTLTRRPLRLALASLLFLIMPILGFIIVLRTPFQAELLRKSFDDPFGVTVPAAFLIFVFLQSRLGWLGSVCSFTLLTCLFALPLSALWHNEVVSASLIGGLLPWSDANGYYYDALRLLEGHAIGWSARRPLFVGYLATILWLTGSNLQVTVAICVVVQVIACYLLMREAQFSLGSITGVVLAVLYFLYCRGNGGLGATLTENLGLPLGALGLLLLWRGARANYLLIIWAGLFMLTLALCARAGAFPVLLFVLLGLAWFYRGGSFLSKRYLVQGFGVIALGFALNYFLGKALTYPGNPTTSNFSNFSSTLYGLAVGGKGWWQLEIDHPGVKEDSEAYWLALEAIKANPMGLLIGVGKAWKSYFPPSEYHAFAFLNSGSKVILLSCYLLCFGGWVVCVLRRKQLQYLLLSLAAVAHLASIAFLPPLDAGLRVYAATMPVIFMLVAIGAGELAKVVLRLLRTMAGANLDKDKTTIAAPAPLPVASLAVSSTLLMLTICGPLILRATGTIPQHKQTGCQAGLEEVIVNINPGSFLRIIRGQPTLDELLARKQIVSRFFSETHSSPQSIKFNHTGRYLRIQLKDAGQLSLDEVEVYSETGGNRTNRALNHPARQSSTVSNDFAFRAVDGHISADLNASPVATTDNEAQPWWEVDLGAPFHIEEIRLWFPDNAHNHPKNFYILASDEPFFVFQAVELPYIKEDNLLKTAGEWEIKDDAEKYVSSSTMTFTYDLVTGRPLWLIAPTSWLPQHNGTVKVCGRPSSNERPRAYGVFYANEVKVINDGSQ